MDEFRNLLGEYFFEKMQSKQILKRKEVIMKYPKRFNSIEEFEREELYTNKVNWSIDDFFDEVFLSGDLNLDFGCDGEESDDDEDEPSDGD